MRIISMLLTALAVVFAASPAGQAAPIVEPSATVRFIEDARVPAQEEGVLKMVFARDGMLVDAGQELAQIDDKLVKLQKEVALAEVGVAKGRSENEISIIYAKATAAVKKANYLRLVKANEGMPGSVSQADIELARLEWEQYTLQAQNAEFEKGIAELELKVSEAKLVAADEHIRRSIVRAPWEGVVDQVFLFTGDWVKPGDPILHMIRMDKLRVGCMVDASKYSPDDVLQRPATVRVRLPGGAVETFQGIVKSCGWTIEGGNKFRVWAVVQNRFKNGYYVLRHGMTVDLTIDVDAPRIVEPKQ